MKRTHQDQASQRELALALARERLKAAAPSDVAYRSGARYQPEKGASAYFELRCLNRPFQVTYPDGLVLQSDTRKPPGYALQLLILHYLVHADGHPLSGRWVAFRELPDGLIYDQAFRARVEPPLLAAFGSNLERFVGAAKALGGYKLSFGDVAFMFDALPRLPMAVIFYAGDDEFPSAVSVLYDSSAGHYLPTEDLAVLGGLLVGSLLKARLASKS